jgi:hypothetical protein
MRNHHRWFTPSTATVLAQLVARMVHETVEIGREFGYRYPAAYDVGFTLTEDDNVAGLCRCQVRVDDTRHRFVQQYAILDGGDAFTEALMRGASTCVHLWAEKHPEYQSTKQHAHAAMAQMKRERVELGEDGHAKKLVEAARRRVKDAKFELKVGR